MSDPSLLDILAEVNEANSNAEYLTKCSLAALNGMLANPDADLMELENDKIAKLVWDMAEAMLKERIKRAQEASNE